jgi:hypothetical protein
MDYKKIQARNKFVGKLSEKIDKLQQDIELLLQVDQALNIQSGGGLLNDIMEATKVAELTTTGQPKIDDAKLNQRVNELTTNLQKKITTLEETLVILLSHISKSEPYDLSKLSFTIPATGLDSIDAEIKKLDSNLDADKFEQFNLIYKKYTTMDNLIVESDYKKDFSQATNLSNEVKGLLHKSITSDRSKKKFSNQVPAKYV